MRGPVPRPWGGASGRPSPSWEGGDPGTARPARRRARRWAGLGPPRGRPRTAGQASARSPGIGETLPPPVGQDGGGRAHAQPPARSRSNFPPARAGAGSWRGPAPRRPPRVHWPRSNPERGRGGLRRFRGVTPLLTVGGRSGNFPLLRSEAGVGSAAGQGGGPDPSRGGGRYSPQPTLGGPPRCFRRFVVVSSFPVAPGREPGACSYSSFSSPSSVSSPPSEAGERGVKVSWTRAS